MKRTVSEALVDAARYAGGYWFVGADGRDRFEAFAAMLDAARALGGALRARGLRRGDGVAIILVEPDAFLTTFLGASVAGLVPTPLAHPLHVGELGAYLEMITPLVRTAGTRAIVTTSMLRPVLGGVQAAAPAVRFVAAWDDLTGPALEDVTFPAADAPALHQFTSGSTSRPKGVVLTHANVAANIEAIGGPAGLGFCRDDTGVGWLPLFHDMGLICQALCPLYYGDYGRSCVFLSPAAFLKRPADWLAAISRHRGTLSIAPNFAYEMCVRRVKDAEMEGLDLSSWRVAGCGAEPIQVSTLQDFARKFARVGFRERSFVPAYGLAEHTLAVTLSPRGRGLRVDVVRAAALAERRVAAPCAPDDPGALRLVSCGPPFPGHGIRIVDDRGGQLGERAVGEILVSGPSVMRGYLNAPDLTKKVLRDGWLSTGDLGYMADGELYVCGRLKETIIVNGRNYFPQDLEWVANQVPGVRPGRVAAFGVTAPGRPDRVVVVAEATGTVSDAALAAELRRRLLEATGLAVDDILIAPKGTIGRTTSGKLRRTQLHERYETGALGRREAAPRRSSLVRHLVASRLGYTIVFVRQLGERFGLHGRQEST
jgi:acyl-CoA synthetase (AMP-forming)/AMP-acid ligase II